MLGIAAASVPAAAPISPFPLSSVKLTGDWADKQSRNQEVFEPTSRALVLACLRDTTRACAGAFVSQPDAVRLPLYYHCEHNRLHRPGRDLALLSEDSHRLRASAGFLAAWRVKLPGAEHVRRLRGVLRVEQHLRGDHVWTLTPSRRTSSSATGRRASASRRRAAWATRRARWSGEAGLLAAPRRDGPRRLLWALPGPLAVGDRLPVQQHRQRNHPCHRGAPRRGPLLPRRRRTRPPRHRRRHLPLSQGKVVNIFADVMAAWKAKYGYDGWSRPPSPSSPPPHARALWRRGASRPVQSREARARRPQLPVPVRSARLRQAARGARRGAVLLGPVLRRTS